MKNCISIIIPTINSEKFIEFTLNELRNSIIDNNHYYELIIINDGSDDNTSKVVNEILSSKDFSKAFKKIVFIENDRNYGQHVSNYIGFQNASGNYIYTMDDDLQNPPSELRKLLFFAKENPHIDVIYGKFLKKNHALYRNIGSKFINWMNKKIFNVPNRNLTISNVRLIKKSVIKKILMDNSHEPYVPGLVLKYSNSHANVTVEHNKKLLGKSNYNLKKLIKLTSYLLFFHSNYPLKVLSVFGFLSSFLILLIGSYYLINTLINGGSVPGWASIFLLVSFSNFVIFLFLTIITEYLVLIIKQTNSNKNIYSFKINSFK